MNPIRIVFLKRF